MRTDRRATRFGRPGLADVRRRFARRWRADLQPAGEAAGRLATEGSYLCEPRTQGGGKGMSSFFLKSLKGFFRDDFHFCLCFLSKSKFFCLRLCVSISLRSFSFRSTFCWLPALGSGLWLRGGVGECR